MAKLQRTRRVLIAARAGAAVAVLACLGAGAVATPAGAEDRAATSAIEIVETPGEPGRGCLPALFALRQTSSEDEQTFRLRISVTAPLCEPLAATAAVYAMPLDGSQWPQRRLETRDFTLSGNGVTEVVFTKPCSPAQLDVVTGPTPLEIAPWGEWHGPLLFPFDTSTARQSAGCGGPAPVVPETPLALLLPVSGAAVVGVVMAAMSVRRNRAVAAGTV